MLPVLFELILWSDQYLPEHIAEQAKDFAAQLRENKAGIFQGLSAQLEIAASSNLQKK